ncbi:hypothetical protein FRB94_009005 [Tulasnella sp. JGI-2019a]|nr:hypothetical protein FRB93_003466 [Tulasnella sp. JGI-2019a]KAG9014847.1 hypothetical protein FRB94_009005 [Tulasnella sp. JGI-2019a]KAG9039993.1 hypothetical protein FRB95_004465 [Tulasnella sp. JGI-2019a]
MSITATLAYLTRFATKYDPKAQIPDMDGKVVIVTGGDSMIGYHTAQQLAMKGARVYLGDRNATTVDLAIAKMMREGGVGGGSVDWLDLDLTNPKAARDSALHFMTHESRLDILINNSGFPAGHYETIDINNDGLEVSDSLAVGHIGHFVFTETLMPLLKHTSVRPGADVRIVTVASEAHRAILLAPKFSSLDGWNKTGNLLYSRLHRAALAKLANILFARELQKRLKDDESNIISMAVHPGELVSEGFARGLVENVPWPFNLLALSEIKLLQTLFGGLSPFLMTPKEGSYTSLYAATSPVVRCHTPVYEGAYLCPYDNVVEPSSLAQDEELARELWEFTECLISRCACS